MNSSHHRCSYFLGYYSPNSYSLSTLFSQKIFFFSGFFPVFPHFRTGVRLPSWLFHSFFNKPSPKKLQNIVTARCKTRDTRYGIFFRGERPVYRSAVTPPTNCHFPGRLHLPMDNGKCIMDNDCVAKGDDFNSFPKEIPQVSIINYQLSIRATAQ